MKYLKKTVLLFCAFLSIVTRAEKADLIIFSYNRPIQLYALLESLDYYVVNLGDIHVIYRASQNDFKDGYAEVCKQFARVTYHEQGNRPSADFKPLTMRALSDCPNEHVLFAVDDNVVKDFIDVQECIELMNAHEAYGFFLKLGKNLNYCYTCKASQPLPRFVIDSDGICTWRFAGTSYDWNYAHTVDMTLYRKKDVLNEFNRMRFTNPNNLESAWALRVGRVAHRLGMCYQESKIVNLPLNRVQNTYGNRHMNFMTPSELLSIFKQGFKMDISQLYRVKNNAVHMEYEPTFIPLATEMIHA